MYIHYQLQFDNYCRALTQATDLLTVANINSIEEFKLSNLYYKMLKCIIYATVMALSLRLILKCWMFCRFCLGLNLLGIKLFYLTFVSLYPSQFWLVSRHIFCFYFILYLLYTILYITIM